MQTVALQVWRGKPAAEARLEGAGLSVAGWLFVVESPVCQPSLALPLPIGRRQGFRFWSFHTWSTTHIAHMQPQRVIVK